MRCAGTCCGCLGNRKEPRDFHISFLQTSPEVGKFGLSLANRVLVAATADCVLCARIIGTVRAFPKSGHDGIAEHMVESWHKTR